MNYEREWENLKDYIEVWIDDFEENGLTKADKRSLSMLKHIIRLMTKAEKEEE